VQSVVGWERRGVVTGANMFARYLGQTLGAALFGAVFNRAMAERLAQAPASMAAELPHDINAVISALHDEGTTAAAAGYLRHSMDVATRDLFLGMAAIGVLIVLALLTVPRHFPVLPEAEAPEPAVRDPAE
jgi:hypothetical protein